MCSTRVSLERLTKAGVDQNKQMVSSTLVNAAPLDLRYPFHVEASFHTFSANRGSKVAQPTCGPVLDDAVPLYFRPAQSRTPAGGPVRTFFANIRRVEKVLQSRLTVFRLVVLTVQTLDTADYRAALALSPNGGVIVSEPCQAKIKHNEHVFQGFTNILEKAKPSVSHKPGRSSLLVDQRRCRLS